MSKRSLTKKIYEIMLIATLEEYGFNVIQEGDYLKAFGEIKNWLIYPVCRCLSSHESRVVRVSSTIKNKVEEKAKEFIEEFEPVIAFCVGEYSYLNSQITLVSTNVWDSNEEKESCFSTSDSRHYYNPVKVNECTDKFLLQANWKCDLKKF